MTKQTFTHTNDKGLVEVEYDVQIQELESVKGSKSPLSGMYLAEAKKIKGRSTRSNVLKSPRILKSVVSKKMTDVEWLTQAGATEDRPEAIQFIHTNWAADGFRLHKIENGKECNCKFCKNKKLAESGKIQYRDSKHPCSPDWQQLFPRSFKGELTLERDAFLDALNQAKVFSREGSNVVKILIRDDCLEFTATSEEYGESTTHYDNVTGGFTKNYKDVEYHYSKNGQDLMIGFNVDFMLEAIKGMGESVTMKYTVGNAPAVFTDGNRTALLMPMNLG